MDINELHKQQKKIDDLALDVGHHCQELDLIIKNAIERQIELNEKIMNGIKDYKHALITAYREFEELERAGNYIKIRILDEECIMSFYFDSVKTSPPGIDQVKLNEMIKDVLKEVIRWDDILPNPYKKYLKGAITAADEDEKEYLDEINKLKKLL